MALVTTLCAAKRPIPLSQVLAELRRFSTENWTEAEVLRGPLRAPVFHRVAEAKYGFSTITRQHEEHTAGFEEEAAEPLTPIVAHCNPPIESPFNCVTMAGMEHAIK